MQTEQKLFSPFIPNWGFSLITATTQNYSYVETLQLRAAKLLTKTVENAFRKTFSKAIIIGTKNIFVWLLLTSLKAQKMYWYKKHRN